MPTAFPILIMRTAARATIDSLLIPFIPPRYTSTIYPRHASMATSHFLSRPTKPLCLPQAILCVAIGVGLAMGSLNCAQGQSANQRPTYWQQRLFFVPYQLNRHDTPLRAIDKVQLLVSRDGVSGWKLLQEAKPNVQGFSYHAPEDGQYWFALRHIDAHGKPWPNDAVQSQLWIVVDSAIPELSLTGELDASGKIVVRYEARDANLRAETLVLEVRQDQGSWTTILPGPPDVAHADRLVGRANASVPFGAKLMEVRGSIADAAGHRGQATTEVVLTGPALRMPSLSAGTTAQSRQNSTVDPFQSTTQNAAQNWPNNNRLSTVESSASKNTWQAPPPAANPYATSDGPGPAKRTPAQFIADGANKSALAPLPNAKINQRMSEAPVPDGWSAPAMSGTHHGGRMVNARTFDIEYDLQSIGPWGISKVELWGTTNGGRTWQSFGVDADIRSPIRVTVPEAGVYGFRILVDGANGAGAVPPQSGDSPELIVAVDLTPPTAQLLSAELGTDNLAGHLLVRWSATDTNLEPRPISLLYSTYPQGPWSTIAAGLENTGSYTWRLERHMPDRFYLRLEARDVAGNTASQQTQSPVTLNRPQPTGTLRGVRPVDGDTLFTPPGIAESPASQLRQ